MHNDSLFNAFARSFEARSETDVGGISGVVSRRSDVICQCGRTALAAIGDPTSALSSCRDSLAITDRLAKGQRSIWASSYAALCSFWISQKRLIKPTTTGVSPMSVQTKAEPDVVLAAKTTTKIPKAINPAEIRNESTPSILSSFPLRFAESKAPVSSPWHELTLAVAEFDRRWLPSFAFLTA
jgi:hypothetical protein